MGELSGEIWVLNASIWASTRCLAWKVTCSNFTEQILLSGLSTAPVSWFLSLVSSWRLNFFSVLTHEFRMSSSLSSVPDTPSSAWFSVLEIFPTTSGFLLF